MSSLPTYRYAHMLLVVAILALAGSAGMDRVTGNQQISFQQLGQELREMDQLQALLADWQKATDPEERDRFSGRVAASTRRLLRDNPDTSFRDRLLRIETLAQWSQLSRGTEAVAEDLAHLSELRQTQHRLRGEIQASISRLEAMQASSGQIALLYERGGQILLCGGLGLALAAGYMLWKTRYAASAPSSQFPNGST